MAVAIQLDVAFQVESEVGDIGLPVAPQLEQPPEHFWDHIFTAEEKKRRYLHHRTVNRAAQGLVYEIGDAPVLLMSDSGAMVRARLLRDDDHDKQQP